MVQKHKAYRYPKPPADLIYSGQGEIKTPTKVAIRTCHILDIPKETVRKLFDVLERTQFNLVKSPHSRRLGHEEEEVDAGPNSRERKCKLICQYTSKMGDYLDKAPFDELSGI
jgi:hypothetical protein